MGTHIKSFATFTETLKQTKAIREKEEMSKKQKEYSEFFMSLLQKYGASSPADLSDEKKKEFFDEINKGWSGKVTPAGEKSLNEAETINEGVLAIAGGILLAVLGLKVIKGIFKTIKGVKNALDLKKITDENDLNYLADQLSDEAAKRSKNGKEIMQFAMWTNAVKSMIAKGEIKNGYELASTLSSAKNMDPSKIFESEEVNEEEIQDLNEASNVTKEELKSFLEKNEKHFAAFLKPKKLIVSLTGDKLIVEPKSNSFAYTVDFGKKKIYTTGKPDSMESVSYVEIGETLKYRTGFGEPIQESVKVNEAEIKSDEEFKEYAETVLKKMHGSDYDEAKGKEVIDGLLSKKKDNDYGALVGMLNKG